MMRKRLAVVLAGTAILTAGVVCSSSGQKVKAAQNDVYNINLGTSLLGRGQQDVIYLGEGNNTALDWKVLQVNAGASGQPIATAISNSGLLLGSGSTLQLTMPWSDGGAVNEGQNNYFDWSGSHMEQWLNGDDFYGNTQCFSSLEKSMLRPIDSYRGDAGTSILSDYFYLPYSDDMTDAALGFTDDESRKLAVANPYWLRNQGTIYSGTQAGGIPDATAFIVDENGSVTETASTTIKKDGTELVVAPMTNLDLSRVLFTKEALSAWKNEMAAPEATDSKYWELTLMDEEQAIVPQSAGIKIDGKVSDTMPVLKAGQKIEFSYKYQCADTAVDRTANRVGILITEGDDKTGSILSYGQFPMNLDDRNRGSVSFILPEGYDSGKHQIYVLAEQVANPSESIPSQVTSSDIAANASVEYASVPVLLLQQTASPKANPAPADDETAFAKSQTVTLSSETPGAEIYYTTDGSDPFITDKLKYTEPLIIKQDAVVKAIAVADGIYDSEISTWEYLIGITNITKIELSPASGEMARGDMLAFIAAIKGDNIRDESLTWTLTGNTSKDTKLVKGIGKTAILHTGEDEKPGTLTVTVTAAADKTKFATAKITVSDKYVVTVEAVDNGTVSVNKTKAAAGTQIVVSAVPNQGYHLQNVVIDGTVITGNIFTMPAKGVTAGAVFAEGASLGGDGSNTGGTSGGSSGGSSGSSGLSSGSSLASSSGVSSGSLASSKNLASSGKVSSATAAVANTDDTSNMILWSCISLGSLLIILIFIKRLKLQTKTTNV